MLYTVSAMFGEAGYLSRICLILLRDTSLLLGAFAFVLFKVEIRKETRFVFLNYAIFFIVAGSFTVGPDFMTNRLHVMNEWSNFYLFQYYLQLYFLLLWFSVTYFVVDHALRRLRVYQKYLLVALVVGGSCGYLCYPYFANPKYLYTLTDYRDYKAIRDAMKDLEKDGISKPTVEEIASVVRFQRPEGVNAVAAKGREIRVAEILPYFRGDDFGLLVMRPLWWTCFLMAAGSLLFLLVFVLYQYLVDPPESAYLEKIAWCLVLYCSFEVLHFYAFTQAGSWELFVQLEMLGGYVSVAAMIALLFLFFVRLRFVQSIEGTYYERQLEIDASHITRWRDAFDNWVLRQFMNPGELGGRFLIHLTSEMSEHTSDKESQ